MAEHYDAFLSYARADAAQVHRLAENLHNAGLEIFLEDREDMEVFLARIRQLLPVLGSDILSPIAQPTAKAQPGGMLYTRIKGAEGRGQRTANGFVIFRGSTAVLEERPSAENYPYVLAQRKQLIAEGLLVEADGFLVLPEMQSFLVHLRPLSSTAGAQTDLSCGKLRTAKRSNTLTNRPSAASAPSREPTATASHRWETA